MRKKVINSIFLLVMFLGVIHAQDMHFTQFYASPLYLNPAFAGANACSRVTVVHRNQWPGISKTYKSYMVTADHFLQESKMGIGILLARDVAGTGALSTTIVNPMLAYEAKLSRDLGVRFGIQPGVTQRSIDYSKLLFGDQIETGSSTSVDYAAQRVTFFDIGAGALAYTSKFWAGCSVYHINKPNQSLLETENALVPIKYTFHGGMKFVINEDEKDENHRRTISPALHYRGQNEFDQFDIGLYYTHGILNFGVWYRGLPFKQYQPGYSNNDAIAFILGVRTVRFNAGYSYDATISKLAGATKGAHEITISYQFCQPKKKKRRIEVACPKF